MSLLIVDDSPEMRRAIRLVVADLVAEISECADGSQALTAYAERRPDWVLMDIRMKQMDGLAATRQIKAVFPEARIIIVTVCKGEDMREAARLAGAYAYIMKDNLLELRQILLNGSASSTSQTGENG
ncbi:MAG: response regulator transcription factor [Acidobacteria bacterium]|nr:response regulator transcription factor [Acidobacteriota bacterium]